MMNVLIAIFAVLSIWDYPARQVDHDRLRNQFIAALRTGDTATMEETCRKGVKLLPDDPVWHYNLACSLAYFEKRQDEAFDELEKAIDLGFRDDAKIAGDSDLRRLGKHRRLAELIEYAKEMKSRPMMFGPMATVNATGIFGSPAALGEQNLGWDFDVGCFTAHLKLAQGAVAAHTGDLYMNRDGGHSPLKVEDFPGITEVKFDKEGRERKMDLATPNVIFPYPLFGNSSMAIVEPVYWRSLPRAMMTTQVAELKRMERMYLKNQLWVFPSNYDTAPAGTNGDVFASITPYWLTTAGRSYSDMPYLRAALKASAAFKKDVKAEIIRRGLLAPTIMTLMRKSLGYVHGDEDYLSPRAHPTAFPANAVNQQRLENAASVMTMQEIPPLAVIKVKAEPVKNKPIWPEITYATAFAWAFVLRSEDVERAFTVKAIGSREYEFVQTHGTPGKVKIERLGPDSARISFDRTGLSPTNRIDVAVFGRNPGTGWGAPSYISFARMDQDAPYSDPALTVRADNTKQKQPEKKQQ